MSSIPPRALAVLMVSMNFAAATRADETDPSLFEESFAVSPIVLNVGGDLGNPITLCLAAFTHKKEDSTGIGASPAGVKRSCSSDRDSYFNVRGKTPSSNVISKVAQFGGDPFEQGAIDGSLWLFKAAPISFSYRIVDLKTGKETWEAFCAAVVYPDPDYSKSKAPAQLITYNRDPKPGSIDKDTKIKCGGMKYALGHQLKTEKPLFIGDPKELSKLAEHTNLESPVKQIEAKNTATTKAHK